MEGWLITLALGTVGYAFLSPIIVSLAAKLLPTASANTQKYATAAATALGVIVALWAGKEFLGRRVKEV
ncbi:MAG: hypothetical protein KGJ13_06165 [Patescibacteria group bacterium]|nr:hypothetical protein [Patescibacteria group bacterium]